MPTRKLRNSELSLERLIEEYHRIAWEEARCWDEIDGNGEAGVGDVFERIVDGHGRRIALMEVESGLSYTFAGMDRAADKIAHWVHGVHGVHGVSQGDRVGIYYKNSFAFLAAVLGLAKAGKPAVLFHQRETPRGVGRLARRYGIGYILGNPATGVRHQEIPPILERTWPGRFPNAGRRGVDREDPAVIIFTSGTSGAAKPALFSHRRLIGAGIAWSLRTYMTERDRCYITLPLCVTSFEIRGTLSHDQAWVPDGAHGRS
ncbi:MAG: fatty-acyl-CoA synthase [Candidatus Kentron sp. G]|nr:MAG: fatty-acyl-CoA synthase [Candidatus Kentron sp. G]